jgi:hypothetical protein
MQFPRPSPAPDKKVSKDVVFVLGAGVDRVLGLPLLNTLFRDLNQFVSELGAPVNKAIRSHLKSFRFNLQTYGGDEAENLGQKLLGSLCCRSAAFSWTSFTSVMTLVSFGKIA